MLSAAELRLRMHDLVCMSGCGRASSQDFPDDMSDVQRQEYIDRDAAIRVDHARRMTRSATAFRKPDADRLQVLHDAVCRAGADCPAGKAHMSDRARSLVAEWAGDAPTEETGHGR